AFVISPFARRHHVSHVTHDHTSVLRLIETKFNLGALTRRDANASNLLDCLDLRRPGFLDPPTLAAPGLPATGSSCQVGTPPPPTGATAARTSSASSPPPGLGHAARASAALLGSPGLSDTQAEKVKLLAHLTRAKHTVS
ncbi:MAG: hypothetical protein M3Z46_00860, partial [Actinomycetota bacterium]|nr:hypothetical protein [Actinomycetota bacterium]